MAGSSGESDAAGPAKAGPGTPRVIDVRDPRWALHVAANGHRLSEIYAKHAPRVFNGDDGEVFAVACLARAHYTLQTILGHPHREVDAVALLRTLYEHVVAFAWIAINPREYYPRFQRWELNEREKLRKDMEKVGAIAPDETTVKRALAGAGKVAAPETPERALEADNYWSRLYPGRKWHLRRFYANLFRANSFWVHPSIMGVSAFISTDHRGVTVGLPVREKGLNLEADATVCFADALTVSALRFGWPPLQEVFRALAERSDG